MNPTGHYDALWISHSSISDYLKCPRAYYLNNVYRDPKTGHKISLMQPALALGQIVHDTIESLSILPAEKRFTKPLIKIFDEKWKSVSGKAGGFRSKSEETEYRERGRQMIKKIMKNPGPIARRAIKIKQDLPSFLLSKKDNVILCGKIDWLEYLPEEDSVHIIDFKTGQKEENPNSLQLPIYYLLASRCQSKPVSRMSYWYLARDDEPKPIKLPNIDIANKKILEIAKKIRLARKLEAFRCLQGGCMHCIPLEKIKNGNAEFVGVGNYNQDIYILT